MKKFLSICLVALCSLSAMYAQENPNSRSNVECGTEVKVQATATNEHFHFAYWEIKDEANSNLTPIQIQPETTNSTYEARSSRTQPNGDGYDTNELTVTLNGNLINLVNTTPGVIGTLTFEAFFTEDPKSRITIIAVDETGTELGTGDYQIVSNNSNNIHTGYVNESVTLEVANVPSSCYVFDHWAETQNGSSIGTDMTYTTTYGSTDKTYYAVYKKKTVNINVKSNDNNKGTVAIVSVTAPAPAPAGN